MNSKSKLVDRPTNDEKLKMYIQDDENTMMYKPLDMGHNKFFGTWSRMLNMGKTLNTEVQEKYQLQYQAYYKAKFELGSTALCFDRCVTDVTQGSGLSSEEKNCVRECYLKKLGSRDDLSMFATQKMARENMKRTRDVLV